ncbi:MAG TPA: hypothetical protein VL500_00630 [Candidatus Eisenbacteria bacterium]|jgi:hypothetical protein|nr:hypothetical protein [Candidatus Eisenbacteria bacterium]
METKIDDIKTTLKTPGAKRIFRFLVAIIVLLLVFHAGKAAGYHKARFSRGWEENYHRNFAGPRGGFRGDFREKEFIDAHGTFGQILTTDGATLVIKGRDGVEKTIILSANTSINRFRDAIAASDLKADDFVVVIGEPDDQGRIAAKLVRVMPAPPEKAGFERRQR